MPLSVTAHLTVSQSGEEQRMNLVWLSSFHILVKIGRTRLCEEEILSAFSHSSAKEKKKKLIP